MNNLAEVKANAFYSGKVKFIGFLCVCDEASLWSFVIYTLENS